MKPCYFSRKIDHVKTQHEEPLHIRAVQGHSGDAVQSNFFTQKGFRKSLRKGPTKYERRHQRRRPCTWRVQSQQRMTSGVRYPRQLAGRESRTTIYHNEIYVVAGWPKISTDRKQVHRDNPETCASNWLEEQQMSEAERRWRRIDLRQSTLAQQNQPRDMIMRSSRRRLFKIILFLRVSVVLTQIGCRHARAQ